MGQRINRLSDCPLAGRYLALRAVLLAWVSVTGAGLWLANGGGGRCHSNPDRATSNAINDGFTLVRRSATRSNASWSLSKRVDGLSARFLAGDGGMISSCFKLTLSTFISRGRVYRIKVIKAFKSFMPTVVCPRRNREGDNWVPKTKLKIASLPSASRH